MVFGDLNLCAAKSGYLAGKIRIWPPLSDDQKHALVEIVLRGTPITPRTVARLFDHYSTGEPLIISDLIKHRCLELHRYYPADQDAQLDLTPTGLVQVLCADNRVWTSFTKILLHLKEKMPNLSRSWSIIHHVSRTASLRLLADAVQFAAHSRKWRDGHGWEALEENFVLQIFKSISITEKDRRKILRAVSNHSESRAFFQGTIDDLYKRAEITLEEKHKMIQAMG